jgi:hypothetical protein
MLGEEPALAGVAKEMASASREANDASEEEDGAGSDSTDGAVAPEPENGSSGT